MRRLISTIILTFIIPQVCFSEGLRNADLAIILASNGLDYSSTKFALNNCNSCMEGNLLMQGNRLEIGKVAFTIVEIGTVKYLRTKGKNKQANIFLIVLGSVCIGTAVNNIRIGRERK